MKIKHSHYTKFGLNLSKLTHLFTLALMILLLGACNFPDQISPYDPASDPMNDQFMDLADDTSNQHIPSGGAASSSSGGDTLKRPVGFINHGHFNATVRAWTFVPLGEAAPQPPSGASTVSTAPTSPGLWPNPSRFLTLPVGTYTWCIEWDEGDIDDDGKIDYFHYIEETPLTLDANDSEDLDMATEVDISAPPGEGPVIYGKCGEELKSSACTGDGISTSVTALFATETSNPPEIYANANSAEYPSPPGIQVSYGGGTTPWGANRILWVQGDWAAATTSDPYAAIGVQVHGDHTIGWARVLFDGVEVWSGNAAAHTIAEGRYGVYVEVRCFAPGTHTIRVEAMGIDGGGGGMSIPASYFGFREE